MYEALTEAVTQADAALAQEDFEGAMKALAVLRAPVDQFFDKVTVNVEDANHRQNRLSILVFMRDALLRVANFSKIEG